MGQKTIFGGFSADWPQFLATKPQMKFPNLRKICIGKFVRYFRDRQVISDKNQNNA